MHTNNSFFITLYADQQQFSAGKPRRQDARRMEALSRITAEADFITRTGHEVA
jgi:hypothetical protein